MPQTEDEVKESHVSNSASKIATWWQKSHFSGRVIMCSVLFGLGLILIGGLIFAINVDDSTSNIPKDDETVDGLPTKAPSNYVGPVVMGIGGFIAIVGVIMCLFETQVCRKKSGDTKPLIADRNADVESKVSETSEIPSSSHCHKNHKHKSRKISSSPKKTKSKRANHSPEQNEQKQSASKSPAISIEKSKSFMTSSEENFLTPPNTLNEHAPLEQKNSREAEIQTSSSLMKSFTSSGTWNQSTEFLTPTASYKGNSVSLDNSVELDDKQSQVNFETNEIAAMVYTHPEYMTPLTAEEEKIQKMLKEVQNDQKKIDKGQLKETTINLSSAYENDTSVINAENETNTNVENMKTSTADKPLDIEADTSGVREVPNKFAEAAFDIVEKSKSVNEETFSDDLSNPINVLKDEFIADENKTKLGSTKKALHTNEDKKDDANKKHILPLQDSANKISGPSHDSSMSHPKEVSDVPSMSSDSFTENMNENIHQIDLESNASSEETLVSLDNSTEKPKCNDGQTLLSVPEENSAIECEKNDDLESPAVNQPSLSDCINDDPNSVTDIPKSEKVGASDLVNIENDNKETNYSDEQPTGKSS